MIICQQQKTDAAISPIGPCQDVPKLFGARSAEAKHSCPVGSDLACAHKKFGVIGSCDCDY